MHHLQSTRSKPKLNSRVLFPTSLSTKLISSQSLHQDPTMEIQTLTIPMCSLENEIKLFQWRSKTDFPIVKIIRFNVEKINNKEVELQVSYDSYPLRLIELRDVPLFKILYLLKQSLIAFERLYDKFGSFMVTPKMVAVNQFHKCKVWLNQNFASNNFKNFQIDQRYFLISIYKIFESRCIKMKNSILFFNELQKCKKFWVAISFIDSFAKENKIVIPSFFKIYKEAVSCDDIKFDPNLTLGRAPKFLDKEFLRETVNACFINNFKKKNSNLEEKVELGSDLKMKKSGDTAADVYTSNTISSAFNSKQSMQIKQSNEKINQTMKKLELLKSDTIYTVTAPKIDKRKMSNNEVEMDNMTCFTPITKRTQKEFNMWDNSQFISKDDANLEEPNFDDSLFYSNNNWLKPLKGLFDSESNDEMKKSFREGKEEFKTSLEHKKLELLDKIGKEVIESSIFENQHQY